MLTQTEVDEIKNTMRGWYGILLTDEQVHAIAETTPRFIADVKECGFDTCAREWFASLVGNYVGIKSHWPMNGDSASYQTAYFKCFKDGANEKGIKLKEGWADSFT